MDRTRLLRGVWVVMVGAFGVACSDAQPPGSNPPPVHGDMAMATPPPGGGGGSGGSGGGGGQNPPPADLAMPSVTPPTSMLPFVVDTVFVSSGFMGDGAMPGLVTMTPAKMGDSTDCNGMRSSSTAAGSCHSVTYAPPAANGMGWGGVYWQFPANNWGNKAGYAIPAGAKKVTFQAKGSKGGEIVKFLAGGIANPMSPYTDSLMASATVTLTSSWAPYSIDLTGQTYSQVLGGFGWVMKASDAATASGSFFVDDIQWQ